MLSFKKSKSLSFVEVMVTAAVLSLGLILVVQGLLVTLGGLHYAVDYINVLLWMDWKFWDIHEQLMNYKTLSENNSQGTFLVNNKRFKWSLAFNLVEGTEDVSLYEFTLRVFWKEGLRQAQVLRTAYALYVHQTKKIGGRIRVR